MADGMAPEGAGNRDALTGELYLNRAEIARAMGTTEPTVDRWVLDSCPVAEKGSNGRAYKFLLSAVKAWRSGVLAHEAAELAEKQAQIRQQQLELVGGRPGDSPMAMPPRERLVLWQEELIYQKAAVERGDLVPVQEVKADFERIFRFVGAGLQSLPDRLARECGLGAAAVAAIQRAVDGWQEQLARDLMAEGDIEARARAA